MNKLPVLIASINRSMIINAAMRKVLLTAMLMFLAVYILMAQTPSHYPPPVPEPVVPSLFNIILYVLVPVALLIYLIYYRRKRQKDMDQNSHKD